MALNENLQRLRSATLELAAETDELIELLAEAYNMIPEHKASLQRSVRGYAMLLQKLQDITKKVIDAQSATSLTLPLNHKP